MERLKNIGLEKKEIVGLIVILVLLVAIPVAVLLIQQQQTLKSKAVGGSCPNPYLYGLNTPVNDKTKQLFTHPSYRFIAVGWKDFQPTANGGYNFSSTDQQIDGAIADGQTPTVKYCDGDCFPDWARQMETSVDSPYCCTDQYVCRILKEDSATDQAFMSAVTEMVNRYKSKVKYWDYGLEPNCRGYSPAKYVRWLKLFYQAVKAADPTAVVIGGHLSGGGGGGADNYLAAMYDNGVNGYFDKLAVDPYGDNINSAFDTGLIDRIRFVMSNRGDGNKKIWVGEWGIADNGDFQRQANLVTQGLNYLAGQSSIEVAFYHNYECGSGFGCWPGSNDYIGMGLLKGDLSEKPAYHSFKTAVDGCVQPTATPQPSSTPYPTATRTPTPTVPSGSTPTTTPRVSITPSLTPTGNPSATPTKVASVSATVKPSPTTIPTLTPEKAPFDLNDDQKINTVDVANLIDHWRNSQTEVRGYDFNTDGVINSVDYSLMLRNFLQ